MTACILHPDDEHPPEPGWQTCWRARDRMAAALRDIPELVDELADHERHMERDWGLRVPDGAVQWPNTRKEDVAVPGRDPVANVLTAGPVNGARSGPRVMSSGERSLPIRVDPTDLLARARPASLAVAVTGLYAADQIGHLAVATELEFWARDWADERRESAPVPTVPLLARWLLDRLDWACVTHPSLDEFARKLRDLRGSLTAATGRLEPFPTPVDRPCPACGWWALSKAPGEDLIRCGHCDRALSDDEYRDHLEDVIKTNWNRVDPANLKTFPAEYTMVWLREDELVNGVTLGFFAGVGFHSTSGAALDHVSYWAPIVYPADPGPRKEEEAA